MATTNLGLATINPADNVSPDPINANMELLDKLGVDYVVSRGTTGMWSHEEYKSGLFEGWGTLSAQHAMPDYEDWHDEDTPPERVTGYKSFSVDYPVTFAADPNVYVSARQDGNVRVHTCYQEDDTAKAVWYLGGMPWGQGADVTCRVLAIGTVR